MLQTNQGRISLATGWRTIVWAVLCAATCARAAGPLNVPAPFRAAFDYTRQGHYRQALAESRELKNSFPAHPLADLIAAEAYWGLIYCETGRITARQVWYVADRKTSSWDAEFFRAVDRTLESSRALRSDPEALGVFYSGLARLVRSRLYALRGQSLKSASDAKQFRADFLEAIAKNAGLGPDANLGLGAYNYYADALSPLLKLIRFFLRIPGGDRAKGLEQLRVASEKAESLAAEAQFELGRIYGIREGRPAEALQLFETLTERYPGNALYSLSAAFQAEAAGKKELALELARRASEAAAAMDEPCRKRVGEAARGAVARLQAPSSSRDRSGL